MGKAEDEQRTTTLPTSALSPDIDPNVAGWASRAKKRSVGRVSVTLAVAVAVLLPTIFLLPPFLRHGDRGGRNRNRDPWFSADVVATFRLQKPVDLLKANIVKLQYDIYEEIGVFDSMISILALEPIGESNWTNVIFGIWPYPEKAVITSTALSLLRSSFMSLVIRQSTLHLTTALFGNSSMFEVLRFPGGITIVPIQSAFLLQIPQTLFRFSLNFSIYQVQEKVSELKGQMKSGLLLNSNENLYFRLTNLEGSTISPPTIVQTSIVLAVGNHPPSLPRLKQLIQNIRNSSAGNLGLNHTVFGRVKQVHLSSFLQHSLNNSNSTGSPKPPPPHLNHHHHHHHHHRHHHHHHHHHQTHFAPAPAPALEKHLRARNPRHCCHGVAGNPKRNSAPSSAPAICPKHMGVPDTHLKPSTPEVPGSPSSPVPSSAQQRSAVPSGTQQTPVSPPEHDKSIGQAPSLLRPPPFPVVSFYHARPPSKSATVNKPPDIVETVSPTPYPSSASGKYFVNWVLPSLWYVVMSL